MKNDLKQMTSRFNSVCAGCKEGIRKGEEIVYFPLSKQAKHLRCGLNDLQKFNESVQDEIFYNNQYPTA